MKLTSINTLIRKFRHFLSVILLLCLADYVAGQGNLLITPRRVVFEGSKSSVDLNLANSGKDTATYAISLVQIRMTEDGQFETITQPDPGQQFADKNIRFFPRLVTLGPGEAQVVKVQLYRLNQLAPGEYRSHFYFRAVPKAKPLGEVETARDSSSISVVLTPVFGITIPVIIRVGQSTTKIILSDLHFVMINDTIHKETVPNLSLVINRSGNMSAYGDIAIYHLSPAGKETRVGIANGIAVYTPNSIRQFNMNLNKNMDYSSGTLRVTFTASSDIRPEKYAEAKLDLK